MGAGAAFDGALEAADLAHLGNSRIIDTLKKQCQQNPRLTSVSLCCMDEDSAVFFYNKGFRFDGEGASSKNTLMDNLQQNPNFPMPDDIFLMGEMKA